jgi:hypothetical protein
MEKRTPVVCSTVFNVMMASEKKVFQGGTPDPLETLIPKGISPSWKSSEDP